MQRLSHAAATSEPRGRILAVGRSLLALAQLSFLLATPDQVLFLHQTPGPVAAPCAGLKAVTLWCATGQLTAPDHVGRLVALAVLAGVVVGIRPRWLCLPHCYVSFSIAADVTVIDGGARVAQIVAGLLVPICLGDTRTWQWTRPRTPLAPRWRGSAGAALLVLRLQVAIVYLGASVTKVAFAPWRTGEAVRALVRDPQFGLPADARPLVEHLLAHPPIAAALGWSVVVVEVGIAASTAGGRRSRLAGVGAAVGLHVAIALALGLVEFSLVMIAATAITCAVLPIARTDQQPAGCAEQPFPGLVCGPDPGTGLPFGRCLPGRVPWWCDRQVVRPAGGRPCAVPEGRNPRADGCFSGCARRRGGPAGVAAPA